MKRAGRRVSQNYGVFRPCVRGTKLLKHVVSDWARTIHCLAIGSREVSIGRPRLRLGFVSGYMDT